MPYRSSGLSSAVAGSDDPGDPLLKKKGSSGSLTISSSSNSNNNNHKYCKPSHTTTCSSLHPSLSSTSLSSTTTMTTTSTATTTTTSTTAEYDNTMWKFVQDLFVQPSSSSSSSYHHRTASWMLRFWCLTLPRLVWDLSRLLLAVTVLAPGFVRFAWYYWMVASVETVTYATESCRQRLDVYPSSFGDKKKNKNSNNTKTPVVVFVPGGAWMIGYKLWGALLSRSLLAAGNVCVVMMDYRNYPWGCVVPDQVQDVQLALNWTKQHIHRYGGDASQIVLVGESAGGHLATLFVLQKALLQSGSMSRNQKKVTKDTTFELEDCRGLVTVAAPLDLSLMMNTCAKHGLDRDGLYRMFGGGGQAAFDNCDPLQLVTKYCRSSSSLQQLPPMLICQGTRDGTVPVQSAKSFVAALQQPETNVKNRVELRIYNGWNHTRANVEGPMEGDLMFHRHVWEATQRWNHHDDVLQRNQDSTVWKDLGRLCPTMLVKLGSFFMPV